MQLQSATTLRMYRAIFEEGCYDVSGLEVAAGDTILDIGANIGLSMLFLRRAYPQAHVLAIEPAPAAFEALVANAAAHGASAIQAAIGSERSRRPLTYYPRMTVMSGLHAVSTHDADRVRQVLQSSGMSFVEAEAIVKRQMAAVEIEVDVETVSSVIRRKKIGRIPLIKIDAEASEVEILQGIDSDHWGRIGCIVGEVHSRSALAELDDLLTARGYRLHATPQDGPGQDGLALFRADPPKR